MPEGMGTTSSQLPGAFTSLNSLILVSGRHRRIERLCPSWPHSGPAPSQNHPGIISMVPLTT